ncbi:MAG TPA: UxaA family hydrolase [Opitutaceae bacterium]|nr:UxaA family hydrolase [Opitutaceae bacterium]
MATAPLDPASVSRLPAPGDNVAIAVRRLEAGTALVFPGGPRALTHTVLEGHRFAVRAIAPDERLLSWGLPFGIATRAIAPGDYVCNQSMLDGLSVRRVEQASFPSEPNFADKLEVFQLEEKNFRPAPPVGVTAKPRTFSGYKRPGRRGVGTRNFVVILGTTSRTAAFARQLAARLQPLARVHPGIDGIVAIAHTEGDGPGQPNNAAEILRALAGFIVHRNVGAILAVDYGVEPVNNARLGDFMREQRYALDDVPHQFLTLKGGLATGLAEGERIVRGWLPAVNALRRTDEPVSGLRVALQCGGSDAFSGVSGNPLAGAVVHEVVRHGGSGNLCETDELMGAEAYVTRNVKDFPTARALLEKIAAFKDRLAWHGVTAESNPSAGNKLRGLYNIALKSLGAAHKKDPRTRIDAVIDYAQPMEAPGFYFMNSPGNDLEGIAGQVGAGCNLFLFVTGNGSITNFPFVPTLKITTTTKRHQLLVNEMDVNAGRYLDGESFEALTAETFDLLLATASGKKTKGEHAGHSQVSLWRNWRQTDTSRLEELRARAMPDGNPLPIAPARPPELLPVTVFRTECGFATERVGLVLPTSLCAAQIARLAAERLNAKELGRAQGISRFVALTHTEGCGFGGESMHKLLHRTYRGYVTHPNVAAALLLEHGCEKVPNDVMRRQLETAGISLDRFGWASVQLDGGIGKALDKIEAWFAQKICSLPASPAVLADFGALAIGLMTAAPLNHASVATLIVFTQLIVGSGGSILIPESDPLLADPFFRRVLLEPDFPRATLAYGQPLKKPGLHIVASETDHWVENLAGFGGCGAHLALTVVTVHARPGHPLLPVIEIAEASECANLAVEDVDGFLSGDAGADWAMLLALVTATVEREHIPASMAQGFVDFQLTRGELGIST